MTLPDVASADEFGIVRTLSGVRSDNTQADASAVSWSAIVAGAAVAAALSLILLIPGAGLGLFSVLRRTHSCIGAATFGVSTILWVTWIAGIFLTLSFMHKSGNN